MLQDIFNQYVTTVRYWNHFLKVWFNTELNNIVNIFVVIIFYILYAIKTFKKIVVKKEDLYIIAIGTIYYNEYDLNCISFYSAE